MARTPGAKGRKYQDQEGNKDIFIKIRVSLDQYAAIELLKATRGETMTDTIMRGFAALAHRSHRITTAQFQEIDRVLTPK